MLACGLRGAVVGAVVQHEHLARERQALALASDGVQSAQQQLTLAGVHHAVAQLDLAAAAVGLAALVEAAGRGGGLRTAHRAILASRAPIVRACSSTSSIPRRTRR